MEIRNLEYNFINPLDCIGEMHNKALYKVRTDSIKFEELEYFTHNFVELECNDKYGLPIEPLYSHTAKMLTKVKEEALLLEKNNESRSNSYILDSLLCELPENLVPYIEKMFVLIENNMTDSINIATEFNIVDITINSNTNLSIEDKNLLWTLSSIIKHSYMFNLEDIVSRGVTAESLILADAEGALGGLLSWKFWGKTAASGLVFGPTGAILSATKEIVKGGIAGSGVHVALHIW